MSLFFCISISVFGQSEILKLANTHMEKGNFMAALNIFQRVADKDTLNAEANYGAGICILNIAMNKKASVKYLERAVKAGIKDEDALFFLGLAYHHNLMYEMADAAFREYQYAAKGSLLSETGKYIQYVDNARKICQAPISVEYKNLGPNINSEYPDYYPMVTPDESFMAFTTRRKSNVSARLEFDGFYPSDIWMSKVVDGEFGPVENIGRTVNTAYDEQLVGLSVKADQLFVYSDNIKEYGDIYYSNYSDGKFGPKIKFDDVINSEDFESSATISSDLNTLFFASDRGEGYGGKDLYMTRKLPTGAWAQPQNLGPKINTEYNEDFPYLFFDGQTLYFASEGHNSIGGYDIFKSTWNAEFNTWTKPVNIGYPVNTTEDNMTISFTEDQRHAYISCFRNDSYGNLDIYLVTFLDKDPRRTIFKSKVVKKDSEQILKNASVMVYDNMTNEEVGNYYPDPSTGSLIMALQPGSYHVVIEADGYLNLETDLYVKGKSDFKDFQLYNFIITPR
jgi:hypothetical protein